MLFVVWPLEGAAELLTQAKTRVALGAPQGSYPNTLVATYDQDRLPLGFVPDATIGRSQYSSAEILDRVKMLSARKRGPRKGTPAPLAPAEAQGLDALGERKPVRSVGAGREPGAPTHASSVGAPSGG